MSQLPQSDTFVVVFISQTIVFIEEICDDLAFKLSSQCIVVIAEDCVFLTS